MPYKDKERVEERSYIAQRSHTSIAVVWVMQMGGGNKWMIDFFSHTHKLAVKEHLV